jgi:hypothetical protein
MGPFLADRVSGGSAYWLCGVAIAASAFSLATLCAGNHHAQQPAAVWKQGACKKKLASADDRRVLAVGPMLEAGSYREIMRDTVRTELTKSSPWRIELTDAPSGGFYVDGTVDEMKVEHDGKTTRVYCELKLWVRSANKPISLLSGSAAVDTTRGPRDIALSRQACVSTVAEELVERLLVGDPWE